jgi:hypothetical protein
VQERADERPVSRRVVGTACRRVVVAVGTHEEDVDVATALV